MHHRPRAAWLLALLALLASAAVRAQDDDPIKPIPAQVALGERLMQ